uniref:Structural maintenance of chromosomes protein 5 n=1 Tax=Parascaris univalens TaxID=6257 RepID=A0A915AI23_PARUN
GTIYPNGCVRRISFVNFLSFESVELIPGPKLNLIIAPNGAGKSTVLCGLCLSLGGDPKLLGRSERLGDFVKCGEKIGSVEVHIWDSTKEENRIVQFYIRASNEAEYRIDGRKSSRAEVRKLAAYYGLQVYRQMFPIVGS